MILRNTLLSILDSPYMPPAPQQEVNRELLVDLSVHGSQATILTGVRRCGKSTLQTQLMRLTKKAFYCNFEDIRLFGMGPDDFTTFLSVLDELAGPEQPVFAVALHLRSQTRELCYASERDLWECDFITPDTAIQVCLELTPANLGRELRGAIKGAQLHNQRRALVVTLDQADQLSKDGVEIEVIPAWRWMT